MTEKKNMLKGLILGVGMGELLLIATLYISGLPKWIPTNREKILLKIRQKMRHSIKYNDCDSVVRSTQVGLKIKGLVWSEYPCPI